MEGASAETAERLGTGLSIRRYVVAQESRILTLDMLSLQLQALTI